MPSHKWSSKIHSSSCSRCGAIRDKVPAGPGWSYRLPDGHGSLVTRPKCDRPTESRRTRKMGRRAKVLSRSRAGSPRLRSKEYHARITITGVDLAKPGAERSVRAEVVDGILHIIQTEVIDSTPSFSVGAVNQKGTL